jgi:hypothetical protein
MGIYSEIQDRMKLAFAGDLSDAVVQFRIFFRTQTDGDYNVATGEWSDDSDHHFPTTVADVAKTDGSCRGILSDKDVDDEKENVKFNYKVKSLMVLDSELNSYVFDFDNVKYFVEIGSLTYSVSREKSDAASATRKMFIQEVQK